MTLIPSNSNEWTIIVIEGPKNIGQIIERFNFMENVKIQSIKYNNKILYDSCDEKKKGNMDIPIEQLIGEKKS